MAIQTGLPGNLYVRLCGKKKKKVSKIKQQWLINNRSCHDKQEVQGALSHTPYGGCEAVINQTHSHKH